MKLNREQLLDQLKIKTKSLSKLCHDFDQGDLECTIDISTLIRVLLHDTSNSLSLLKQLNEKNSLFLNTSGLIEDNNELPQYTLVNQLLTTEDGIQYSPFIDNSIVKEFISFENWWETIVVYIPKINKKLSRKDLVLKLANKYGAHVSTDIPKYYHDIFSANDNAIGFSWFKNSKKIKHSQTPLFPTIRQISHELIISLNARFQNEINLNEHYFSKIKTKPNASDGIGNILIYKPVISKSLTDFNKLSEQERNTPIDLSSRFLSNLQKTHPSLELDKDKLLSLLYQLKPYNLSEDDLINYVRIVEPHLDSYVEEIQVKFIPDYSLDLCSALRISVMIMSDDFFIDSDPPIDYKTLRNKYNKTIVNLSSYGTINGFGIHLTNESNFTINYFTFLNGKEYKLPTESDYTVAFKKEKILSLDSFINEQKRKIIQREINLNIENVTHSCSKSYSIDERLSLNEEILSIVHLPTSKYQIVSSIQLQFDFEIIFEKIIDLD